MTSLPRGLIVAAVHVALVATLGAKLQLERDRYPRVWARTAPVDPMLPIRGRYVSLLVEAQAGPDLMLRPQAVTRPQAPGLAQAPQVDYRRVTLHIENGVLVASAADGAPDARPATVQLHDGQLVARLTAPVAYFIPPTIDDPSRRAPGEELWVEVTLPPQGSPRPIRLGVKRDGVLTPLEIE